MSIRLSSSQGGKQAMRRVTDMPKEKTAKTTMRLPADLWRETKIQAIKRGVDAQDLVAEALAQYLKKGGAR
jgi:predicted DNA binding CopG/RHH family protein